jgi:hypothetical protein
MHYHVTINGETLSWAHIAATFGEAARIEAETRDAAWRSYRDVVSVETCEAEDCGDYQDMLAFEAGGRALLDIDVLNREHARMVIESDGHGPV